jgi:hypothetical protein
MDYGVHEGKSVGPLVNAKLELELDTLMAALKPWAGKKTMEEYRGQVLTTPTMLQYLPGFAHMARIAMSFPLTSVENERQFSFMKLVKSQTRNRLGESLLNALSRIKRSKYTVRSFPYEKAIKVWQKQKKRRGVKD